MVEFLVRRRMAEAFQAAGYDTTPEEWALICLLNENETMTPGAIALANGRDKTTVSRMVDRLVRKGVISRQPVPGNRRSVALRLSSRGKRRFEMLSVIAGAIMVQALDELDAQALSATNQALVQMAENLTQN